MLITAVITLFIWFTGWYLLAIPLKNAGIVDIGWGLGFVVLGVVAFSRTPNTTAILLVIPVSIWGLRLAWHIGKRNLGKPEDFRYAAFRRDWGKSYYLRSYFQLFLFQGLLMGIIAMPYLAAISSGSQINYFLAVIGVCIWCCGFLMEAISDAQLKTFVANSENKGKFIESGLWQYTRHPNYFGEAVLWWGIWVIAFSSGAPVYTIVGPVVITLLLRYVSGVPMLEKRLATKEGFHEYAARVPIFIPIPVRKHK